MTSKRRYVLCTNSKDHPTASPPTTSDSSGWEDDAVIGESKKKKRKCTRKNKVNYNETNSKPHLRESYVFSTALANLAASAVKHHMCSTIIEYHQGIPREPNRLTLKLPKVTSKLLHSAANVKNRNKPEKKGKEVKKPSSVDKKPLSEIKSTKSKPAVNDRSCKSASNKPVSQNINSMKSPLTPPSSPKFIVGDYALSVSERIKCRSRACAPKFYGEQKEEKEECEEVSSSRSKSTPRVQRKSESRSERSARRQSRRDSIESDGEKIRSILEKTEMAAGNESTISCNSSSDVVPKVGDKEDVPVVEEKKEEPPPELQKPPEEVKPPETPTKPEPDPKTEPDPKLESKCEVKPEAKPEPKMLSPKQTKRSPHISPKLPKLDKPKAKLLDAAADSLFEVALGGDLKSPRMKPKFEKALGVSFDKIEKKPEAESYSTKFKPVKQASGSPLKQPTETVNDEKVESELSSSMPKFKPLPISGNQKKNKSFKFRTTHGVKHDMNLVDSIFCNDSNSAQSELSPLSTKPPLSSSLLSTASKHNKLSGDRPPRPELVMGIPNLQGPTKPPTLTPAHNSTMHHVVRTVPPPLSSPKISNKMSTISPASVMTSSKRPSNEGLAGQPPERKKKRFMFPTDEPQHPTSKVTSPISPSSPVHLKGPGSSRVSPISPQTKVDNVITTPLIRNGLPLHKPSPKNSPQNRRTPLEFLADFSERRSPLALKPKTTSPITPKPTPSTVGQFYQPNAPLNSCSRSDVKLSDSVIEHSKLSAQQLHNRSPVVTINHHTISLEQEKSIEEAAKHRISVEAADQLAKKQQQEIFARQQLFSRAFTPYQLASPTTINLASPIPTTINSKLTKQFELSNQVKTTDIGSLVDLYGRGAVEHRQSKGSSAPATNQRQTANTRERPPNIRTTDLLRQERDRIITQERLLAQQRHNALPTREQGSGTIFSGRQDSLLQRENFSNASSHLQHLPYGSNVLNQIPYNMLNPQLYKQLANDPALTQVTSASILQSIAGYHHQLQLAAAAGKLGPLAHLYQSNTPSNTENNKSSNQFGVIRP